MSHLHGRHHRLRAAGMWSHGNLHQMWQEDERVPHLQAVRSAGRARLQVLKNCERRSGPQARTRPPSPGFVAEYELLCMTSHRAYCCSGARATSRSLEPDCCLLPTMVCLPSPPPLLTHAPVPLLLHGRPSSAAPGHSLFLSLVY